MISIERLKEILHYDETSGVFTWKEKISDKVVVGNKAGCGPSDKTYGYISIKALGVLYRAHRLAWFYHYGKWPENQIDHIDGVRHNNAIRNLREADHSINGQNKRMAKKPKSGLSGAASDRSRFRSQIKLNKKIIHIGCFASAEEAHLAYIEAKRKFHPGFVDDNA